MTGRYTRRSAMALGMGGLAATTGLTGCGDGKFYDYDGPPVTQVVVQKSERRMHLIGGQTILQSYDVQLGFTSQGPKRWRGDGRTPEGLYRIDRRNPNSRYYLSVGIDYPNRLDREWASARRLDPGGDIFIHGHGDKRRKRSVDWTAGCVAVTNREMRDVYAMVRNGTHIWLHP